MPNRLAGETSPYLLQHAGNPVEWFPWGGEALSRAKAQNKPILLSIGYSACHWCHVMAHESFEDERVAALMNDLFVNIKVDREERPDLDQIYQMAHAMLTQRSGGWPLTMFLAPDQAPFFGGTYFPKESRYGLTGFAELLPRIAAAYREQGSAIAEQSERLKAALALTNPDAADARTALPADALNLAYAALRRVFDPTHGGFGAAPKFPHAVDLELCLRRYALRDDKSALEIVATTLERIAAGGIHDQLGGGFCRYSVDAEWTIPHFEKMLYDNAALLALYADAWRATGEVAFERAARGIAAWVLREMRSPEGAFYSSVDADSEHEEGKFYVWTSDELEAPLTAEEWAVARRHWGLDRPPNFEHAAWHLRVAVPLAEVANELGIGAAAAQTRLEQARGKLFAARELRVRPGRDDKVLTSWNALMIGALARAARAFGEAQWQDAARRAADFLRSALWHQGRLLATYKDGRAHLNAYLDDHAYLLAALLELMQAGFRRRDLDWAIEIADALLQRFEDAANGGFFFTSHDHEALIHRPKPAHDNATPAGNGVAAQALVTLGHWLGEPRYLDAAERTLRAFASELGERPSGVASLLIALEDSVSPPTSVLLRGDPGTSAAWQRRLERTYRPHVRTLDLAHEGELPGALSRPHEAGASDATAWVCSGTSCLPPIHTLEALEAALAVSR
ncbi:MAG: thioredoxin domain-containing protein [Betaproteobacteria bacterium]|nr:MAG: thioredoxin domain-containing protein [Betaproteobacteria bacterium]